jgi:hypothetical protein
MAKIAFILLCHRNPDEIIRQAARLTATGDVVAIHFDGHGAAHDERRLREALADRPGIVFAGRRVKCGWGQWSLVRATLAAVQAALDAFPDATHFYLSSGDCAPVKSAAYARQVLDAADRDHIESFDFFASDWIRTGLKRERLVYRHVFNERRQKRLFYAALEMQRRLGLERRIPRDIQVMIGSQWWCLRRRTVEAILGFIRSRPDVVRFFRTTWIPDETFFQTLVRHLVPDAEIECRSPTFKMFSDYGMPVTFYNDQYDLLISQDYLFARKISPEATVLKERLGALWESDLTDFAVTQEGPRLYQFLTGRGRIGRRFGPRFWERESTLGPDRELYMIVCKKWHVGKRVMHAAQERLAIRGIEYLFDEATCPLPHLGGIERTPDKRNRHRRALMRMLFDYYGADRLMICLDPENVGLMEDFMSDRATTRLLEVQCAFDDQYLVGHARRVGLATERTPDAVIERMLPALRQEFADQSVRIREAEFQDHWRLRQDRSLAENAAVLADYFNTDADTGYALAGTPHLFAD